MTKTIQNLKEVILPKFFDPCAKIIGVESKKLTQPGENYGSMMLALKIKTELLNEERTITAVAKMVPDNEFIRKMFNSPLTFNKELEFYRTVIPTLIKFQKDNGTKPMDLYANFLGGRLGMGSDPDAFDDKAIILLENLKLEGYSSIYRIKGFDLESAKCVLENLAEFHAVPIALKLKNPDLFKKKVLPFLKYITVFQEINSDETFQPLKEAIMDIVKQNEDLVPFLSKFQNAFVESKNNANSNFSPNEPFSTIVHNDFWVNNIMVKTKNCKSMQCKFIDFQIVQYDSPIIDLIFFILDSVQNDVIIEHFDELIRWYHDNFVSYLEKFNVDLSQFTFENFNKEINVAVRNRGLLFKCVVMLMPIFATGEQVKDLESIGKDDLKKKVEVSKEHKEKLWLIVKEFNNRNWL